MQSKNLYFNGCSFMWGVAHNNSNVFPYFEETKDIDTSHGLHWNGQTLFSNYDWVRQKLNISGRIKEHYGINIVDESIYGGSLQRVVRKTYNWIFNNKELAKDTLFILEWPIGARNEMYIPIQKRYVNYTSNFQNFDNIDPYLHRLLINEYAPNFYADGIMFLEDLQSFIGLLHYIKSINAKCLVIMDEYINDDIVGKDCLKYIGSQTLKQLFETEILPHIIEFKFDDNTTTKSMVEYINESNATFTKDTNNAYQDDHNSIRGSKIIASQIIDNIQKHGY